MSFMINVGLFGSAGRAGTMRKAVNEQKGRARIYGYVGDGYGIDKTTTNYVEYKTYSEMVADPNIDAIIVSNCFCDHVPYVIEALKAGKHVLCEITAATTPKQCVELCEAAEASGKIYALLENYAVLPPVLKMKEEMNKGFMGPIVYAEGEYCHPLSELTTRCFDLERKDHWRLYRPCTFYSEHALGPLMYLLDVMPTKVLAKPVDGGMEYAKIHHYNFTEIAGLMLVETNKNILLNVKGCTHYAGAGRYYRVNGAYGGVEVPRGKGYTVRKFYSQEAISTNKEKGIILPTNEFNSDTGYPVDIVEQFDLKNQPHSGSDIIIVKNFIDAIENKEPPIFDVYKACAMSAVSIYGWRSILDKKEYDIPDFKDKAIREELRKDDLTPFSINGSIPTLPCTLGKIK